MDATLPGRYSTRVRLSEGCAYLRMSAPSSAQLCESTVSFLEYLVDLANTSYLTPLRANFSATFWFAAHRSPHGHPADACQVEASVLS
jgi:hypothetical protein